MGVTVRQKKKGKGEPWWVFVAYNNKRTSRMVGDKKAADDVASRIRAKLQLGEFNFEPEEKEPETPTFKEYAVEWITKIAPAMCKASTVTCYEDLLRLHVLPVFGDMKLKEISRGKVKDFFAGKILEGYAQNTVRHMRDVIRDTRSHNRMYRKEVTYTLLYLACSRQYLREACCRCADDGV